VNPATRLHLCVLASGSTGNCSVLRIDRPGTAPELLLIDAGISPRRTRATLSALGVGHLPLSGVVLTHLDHDHWHKGWLAALPSATPVWCHREHHPRARSLSMQRLNLQGFDDGFRPVPDLDVASLLASHDNLGSVVFRFSSVGCEASSLGFATDIGRMQPDLIHFLSGVPTLAIESNYCPVLQQASDRPQFLKDRIMNGHGHLSNAQCHAAVRSIAPTHRVVLLHLSRQCNTPERAALPHRNAGYELVLSHAVNSTQWLELKPSTRPSAPRIPRSLFEGLPAPGLRHG